MPHFAPLSFLGASLFYMFFDWHACPLPCTPPATCALCHACPCHACLLPHMPLPAMHAPCHACLPAMHAPLLHTPPATHAPCHVHLHLPCIPPNMHTPLCHTCPHHACPPVNIILDTCLWKHYLSATSFADSNKQMKQSISGSVNWKHLKFKAFIQRKLVTKHHINRALNQSIEYI